MGGMVWRELPVPVIAAVHGVAFGGGFQVALGADMRYATPGRENVGHGNPLGPRARRRRHAAHAASCARGYRARTDLHRPRLFGRGGFSYGLVTRVCADPRAAALETAREIAGKNPHAIRAAKRLLNLAVATDAETGLTAESAEQVKIDRQRQPDRGGAGANGKRLPKFAEA